jgi:hypothetical protein
MVQEPAQPSHQAVSTPLYARMPFADQRSLNLGAGLTERANAGRTPASAATGTQESGRSVSMPRGRPGLIHAWPDLTFGETINPAAQRRCGRLWAPRNCATNAAREPTPMGQPDLHSTASMCTSASPARCPSDTYPGRSSAERCTRTPPRVAAQQRPPLQRASRSPHDRQRRHRAVSVAPARQDVSRGRAPRLDLRARGTAGAVDCRRLGPGRTQEHCLWSARQGEGFGSFARHQSQGRT